MYARKENIYPASVSKHNSNREKQVFLLMHPKGENREAKSQGREAISEGQRRRYLAVKKKLSPFIRGITSADNGDY